MPSRLRLPVTVRRRSTATAITFGGNIARRVFSSLRDATGAAGSNQRLRYNSRAAFDPQAEPDDDAGTYQDASIETLQRRGLIVLTCHTAVEEQARAIVKRGFAPAGMTASDVADDILTHLIAGALVVPSMVATIAVLQSRYGYTYLTPL